MLACTPDLVVQTDRHGTITYLNAAARAALGLAAGEPLGHLRAMDFAPAQTRRQFRRAIAPALHAEGHWVGETVLRLGATDEVVAFSQTVVAHRGRDGRVARLSAVLRDLSARQQVQRELQRQADILRAITEAIPATVVVVDSDGRYRFANSAFARQCGLPREQILGRRAAEVLGEAEVARRRPYMQRAYAGETVHFTLDFPGPSGARHLALSCVPLKLAGMFDGFVGISQDITAQHHERERLARLAERDPLTGLLNRAGFERQIALACAGGRGLALLYVDLDRFKPVNDEHGHPAGDQLLQQFASRLGASVREADSVARLGGDEFAVLLPGARDLTSALAVADKLLAGARRPFDLDTACVQVSASIGVAFGLDPVGGWSELVARADMLLYRAKTEGRDRAVGADPPAALSSAGSPAP